LLKSLKLFQREEKLTPEELFLTLSVVSIVTIFWPLVILVSSTQALKYKKLELESIMPVILVLVVLGVSAFAVFAEAMH
jgi:hypothetical protein